MYMVRNLFFHNAKRLIDIAIQFPHIKLSSTGPSDCIRSFWCTRYTVYLERKFPDILPRVKEFRSCWPKIHNLNRLQYSSISICCLLYITCCRLRIHGVCWNGDSIVPAFLCRIWSFAIAEIVHKSSFLHLKVQPRKTFEDEIDVQRSHFGCFSDIRYSCLCPKFPHCFRVHYFGWSMPERSPELSEVHFGARIITSGRLWNSYDGQLCWLCEFRKRNWPNSQSCQNWNHGDGIESFRRVCELDVNALCRQPQWPSLDFLRSTIFQSREFNGQEGVHRNASCPGR